VLYLTLAFFMVLPLFGVMVMETGEVSPFIDEPGAANGASLAFTVHLLAFFLAFMWALRLWGHNRVAGGPAGTTRTTTPRRYDNYASTCALLFAILAVMMLFVFGGINVLALSVDKAEFRISLGPFGAIMTLATKWLMPAMFAALVRAGMDQGWTGERRAIALFCGLCLCIVGASWGFKTTIVLMLLPALILVSWRLRARAFVALALFTLVNVVALSLFFDQHEDLGIALDALVFRLTALQGDLAWYTWDKVAGGGDTPGYLKTFLPVLGDGVLRQITGADPQRDYADWASYYFGPAMTLYGGYPVEGVMMGVTNQATIFAEALVIGGKYFFVMASAFFGLLVGWVAARLKASIDGRRYAAAATLSTFFSFTVLSWVLGNGFSSLFYLINLVGAAGTYAMIHFLLRVPRRRKVVPA